MFNWVSQIWGETEIPYSWGTQLLIRLPHSSSHPKWLCSIPIKSTVLQQNLNRQAWYCECFTTLIAKVAGQGACPCPTLSRMLSRDKDWYRFLPFSTSICSLSTWHCPSLNVLHPHGLVSNFPKHPVPTWHPCGKVWRERWVAWATAERGVVVYAWRAAQLLMAILCQWWTCL